MLAGEEVPQEEQGIYAGGGELSLDFLKDSYYNPI